MVNTSITTRDGTTIAFDVLGEGPPLILVAKAGGSAFLYGVSPGAALALEAAAGSIGVTKLAKAIPHAEHRTLKDQTLQAPAEVLAPLLVPFSSDQFVDRIDRRMGT